MCGSLEPGWADSRAGRGGTFETREDSIFMFICVGHLPQLLLIKHKYSRIIKINVFVSQSLKILKYKYINEAVKMNVRPTK